jgi:hypothetical protein
MAEMCSRFTVEVNLFESIQQKEPGNTNYLQKIPYGQVKVFCDVTQCPLADRNKGAFTSSELLTP